MKKVLVILLFVGLISAIFSNGKEEAKEKVKVEFWDMVWGPASYVEAGKALANEYNNSQDQIELVYQSTPWTNWYQTFSVAIASNTSPDISTGAGYQAFQFSETKIDGIHPLDDFVDELKDSGVYDDFIPGTLDSMKYNGHYRAIPWAIDIRVPFYRTDLFEAAGVEPPKTWKEFIEVSKALTDNGTYGLTVSGQNPGFHALLMFMINNGGGLFDSNGNEDSGNIRNREALDFFAELVEIGSINPAGAGWDDDMPRKAFSEGEAAIIIDGPGAGKRFSPEVQKNMKLMSPIEGLHGDFGTIYWINNIMVYNQTEVYEEAKDVLHWWIDHNVSFWEKDTTTQLPARMSFAEIPILKQNEEVQQIIREWLPVAKTTAAQGTGLSGSLNEIEGDGYIQRISQALMIGGNNMEEIYNQLESGTKDVLGE